MNLAPLANVVAYLDRNPSRLAGQKQALQARFDAVWSPHGACVMATRALPRSVPDGEELRAAGIAFAEGRDSVAAGGLSDIAIESLPGSVGFARAEPDRLVVVRSGPGTVPWYVWRDDERALVATSFTELVRLLPGSPELDALVCGMWAGHTPTFPNGRTFLQGVFAVPPGHTADVRPGRPVSPRSWWSPWPVELPWPSREERAHHVQRFRDAVLAVLNRELADDHVNLLTLSGGVDSSALAYLAVRQLGRPLAALTFVPPVDAVGADLHACYVDPVVADLGITPHVRQTIGPANRLALVAGSPPVAFPVAHPALQMLSRLVQNHGFEVLVGGEFADEICGGWFALPDWLDAISLRQLVTRTRTLPRGRRDVATWARRRIHRRAGSGPWRASLPDWVHHEINEEYGVWRAAQEAELRAARGPHRYQRAVLSWLDGAVAMNWEVCSSLQVRRAFPFLSAEILTVISACHPDELLGPGTKRLERQAFAQMVPERQLHRLDKGTWTVGDEERVPAASSAAPASLDAVLRPGRTATTTLERTAVEIISRFAEQVAATRADSSRPA